MFLVVNAASVRSSVLKFTKYSVAQKAKAILEIK